MAGLPSPEFWRGRRVLLTGHTGFKGAWAALWLGELGAKVTGFSLAPETSPNLFELASIGSGIRSCIRDLRDAEGVRKISGLYRLIQNGWLKPGTTLFWDEPEANINPRWMAFAGYRLTNMPGQEDSFIAGATHRLPYMFDATLTVESSGDLRLGLGKTFQLTSRLSAFVRAEYDTADHFMGMAGASYTLTKQLGLIASWDSDYGFGAGLAFRF